MPSSKFITVSIAEWGDRHECFLAFSLVFFLIQLLIWQVIRPNNRFTLTIYVRVCTVKWEFKECDCFAMNIGITVCEHLVLFLSQWVKQVVWSALVYAHFRFKLIITDLYACEWTPNKPSHAHDLRRTQSQCDVPTRLESQ